MSDTIYRQAAIDAVRNYPDDLISQLTAIEDLPSAQPEHLTDDDFETIRIHLSAYKEKLCNQCRWKEAEEYQRIIDRFMSFASAQPEIIRCKECKWYEGDIIEQKEEPMTDTEIQRKKAICEAAHVADIDDVSDGFHTFRQLYYQRMILFAAIVKQNKDKAWKSFRHEDGELCFGGGWFIVGVDTPEGSYTYHYEDNYYCLFDCKVLERGKHWDGHTEKDATRLLSLPSAQPEILACGQGELVTDVSSD